MIEKVIQRFALRSTKLSVQHALQYRNRRLNKDLLPQLIEYAQNKMERQGANEDLMLFVAELGALLHDKTFLKVLQNGKGLNASTRKRMRERAELLKNARKNATKKDREQIR